MAYSWDNLALGLWRQSQRSLTLRLLRAVGRQWQERLTQPGRYVVLAAGGFLIAGSFPEVMIGAPGFAIFVAIIGVSFVSTMMQRPKLRATRLAPKRTVAGAETRIQITVTNEGRRPAAQVGAYEFRLPPGLAWREPLGFLPTLAPGETYTFHYTLAVGRRGTYDLPGPSALTAFPFGITLARRFTPAPHRLVVYPAYHRLAQLDIPVTPRHQPGGIALTSNVGESMEFIGNREYRVGDRQRDLHPRSWARVGYPVVRQFHEEFLTRVALLLDTYVPAHVGRPAGRQPWWKAEVLPSRARLRARAQTLEANLSLAAAIADYLARQEYVVDLFAAGPELYHFQAGRSLAYFENILDILACIEECPRDPLEVIGPKFSQELRQISTVILLLLDWDQPRRELVQRILAEGVAVKTVVISDQLTPDAVANLPGTEVQCLTVAQVREGITSL